jgi:hypothetical protein
METMRSRITVRFNDDDADKSAFDALFSALGRMAAGDEDEPQWIGRETHAQARTVLSAIALMRVDAPKVFSHGGDAVVFSWARPEGLYQLTVSEGVGIMGRRAGGKTERLGLVDLEISDVCRFEPLLALRGTESAALPRRMGMRKQTAFERLERETAEAKAATEFAQGLLERAFRAGAEWAVEDREAGDPPGDAGEMFAHWYAAERGVFD